MLTLFFKPGFLINRVKLLNEFLNKNRKMNLQYQKHFYKIAFCKKQNETNY